LVGLGEFGLPPENAEQIGHTGPLPPVERIDSGAISALKWGTDSPQVIFLHGGGQNAHTWDLVALELDRPAIAIDLPGHGHSSWRDDRDYSPVRNAVAVATVIEQLAPHAAGVVGMSLGGATTIRLAATRPDLVRRAVLVDVTPGSARAATRMTREQRGATALIGGPRSFASLTEMTELAVRASPGRPASAVRRGVLHNARQLPDGTWTWRYDQLGTQAVTAQPQFESLWDDLAALTRPTLLVRGGDSAFVTAEDQAEAIRRLPAIRVEVVPGSGHAVQSDRPKALADLIREFLEIRQ